MYDPTLDVYRFHLEARLGRSLSQDEFQELIPHAAKVFHARAYKYVPEKYCPNCGKKFTPNIINGKEQNCCSNECRVAYSKAHSKKNNPWESDWTGRPLTDNQRNLMKILDRPLQPGEYSVKIGNSPNDYRIMSKQDKARYTHNTDMKWRLVEDGNFHAHVELNPEHPKVCICENCGKTFMRKPGKLDNHYCSTGCRAEMRRKMAAQSTSSYNGRVYMRDSSYPVEVKQTPIDTARLVAQQKLGRQIRDGEVVHHLDMNLNNNNADNIIVFASQADCMLYLNAGELGSMLARHPNGAYYTWPLTQIVDITPVEKRSIPK